MNTFLRFLLISFVAIFWTTNLTAQYQFANPGFEEWEEIGLGPNILEPTNWSSIKSTDDPDLNNTAPLVWGKSDDAHTGNYSLYLFTLNLFGIKVPGTITNGRIHASMIPDSGYTYTDPDNAEWHTRLSAKPDSLVGWYKAKPEPGDYAKVKVVMHNGFIAVSENQDTSAYIGSGTRYLSGEVVNEWKRFSVPIKYYKSEKPEFILITISSSKGTDATPGSELWVDDLKLIYNNGTGITEENPDNLTLFSANNHLNVLVTGDKSDEFILRVYDISGKLQLQNSGKVNQKSTYAYDLPTGIYVVSVSYNGKVLTKKISL